MRRFSIILLLLISFSPIKAQIDTAVLKKNIHANMDSMLVLFKNKEWEKYADFMHPAIVKMVGGKKAFGEFLTAQMASLGDAQFDVFRQGQVLQLLKSGEEYQGIMESFMQMQITGKLISGSSYDIVTSTDGINWNFTRIDEAGVETFKMIIPGLSDQLKLPKNQMIPGKTLEEFLKTYKVEYY